MSTQYELNSMHFKVHEIPEGQTVLDAYPKLADLPVFSNPAFVPKYINQNDLHKWIIFMFDEGSPARNITNQIDKLVFARNKSKIRVINKINDKAWSDIFNFENNTINIMIVEFLRANYSPEYMQLSSLEVIRAKQLASMTANVTKPQIEAFRLVNTEMAALSEKILSKGHSIKLEETLIRETIKENLNLNLLDIISKFEVNETIFPEYAPA